MKQIINIFIPGEPVPAARARSGNGHHYTPEKYADYKRMLASKLYEEYAYLSWDIPPVRDKRRAKWLKTHRYALSLVVYQIRDVGDLDNYVKGVQDAIADAGLIANDKQIKRYKEPFEMGVSTQNPGVDIKLWEL